MAAVGQQGPDGTWMIAAEPVARHAGTVAGPGSLRIAATRPTTFEIAASPRVPAGQWHAAVSERLFASLADARLRCAELACTATGAPACRFATARRAAPYSAASAARVARRSGRASV